MSHTSDLTRTLFAAKRRYGLTFSDLSTALGRDEVAVAAIFYGAAHASAADIVALSNALGVVSLAEQFADGSGFPERGVGVEMPPKEPLIYRLYEIVQTYGWAYKAVLNEMFGDGIVSAIAFSTKVEKEVEADGSEWAVITWRGKWLPYKRF